MINLLQAAVVEQPGMGGFWIMMLLMIAVLYFFMWRPESKRRKEMAKFREGLKKGDKIITAGGIYGTVKEHGGGRQLAIAEIGDAETEMSSELR